MSQPLDELELTALVAMTVLFIIVVVPWYIRRRHPMDSVMTYAQARMAERTYDSCFAEAIELSRTTLRCANKNVETYIEIPPTLSAPLLESKVKSG